MVPSDSISDRWLLEQASFLRALCASLVQDEHLAEDVAQEVFIRARGSEPAPGNQRTWLRTIARSIAANFRRSDRRRRRRELAVAGSVTLPSAAAEAVSREVLRSVVDAVLALHEPYQTAVLMRYYEDLPPREIARRLQVPVATAKSWLARGRRQIRNRLEGTGWRAQIACLLGRSIVTKSAGPTFAGGLLMTTKLKILSAVVLLVAVGLLSPVWRAPSNPKPMPPRNEEPPVSSAQPAADPEHGMAMRNEVAAGPDSAGPQAPSRAAGRRREVVRLTGRLLEESGGPLSGAIAAIDPPRVLAHRSTLIRGVVPSSALTARTGADGRFVIEDAGPGEWQFSARKPGYEPILASRLVIPRGPEHELRDLVLRSGVILRGRVASASGRGIAAARIFTVEPLTTGGGGRDALWERTVTDPAGSFVLDEIGSRPITLAVSAPGFVPLVRDDLRIDAGGSAGDHEWTLERGWSIQGELEGGPSAGAVELRVRAVPAVDSPLSANRATWALYEAAPGRFLDGRRFVVDGLAPGHAFYLSVQEVLRDGRSRARTKTVRVTEAEPELTLRYQPDATLVLRAVDSRTGTAIRDLRVCASISSDEPPALLEEFSGVVRTVRDDGAVAYAGLPEAKRLELSVGAAEYQTRRIGPFELPPGSVVEPETYALEPARRLRVRVTSGSTGAPVAGARAWLEGGKHVWLPEDPPNPAELALRRSLRTNRTDAEGFVVLQVNGDANVLRVAHAEYATHTEQLPLLEDADAERAVTLERGATVTVHAVDGNGRPVPDIDIEHRPVPSDGEEQASKSSSVLRTDLEGKAVFTGLSAGRHVFQRRRDRTITRARMVGGQEMTVSVSADDRSREGAGARFGAELQEVELRSGDVREVSIGLPRRLSLRGQVWQAGEPLEDAELLLLRGTVSPETFAVFGSTEGRSAFSGVGGCYLIEEIEEGEYTLVVTHRERVLPSLFPIVISKVDRSFDPRLPLTALRGRVLDRKGDPVKGAFVSVMATPSEGAPPIRRPRVMMIDESGVMSLDAGEPDGAKSTTLEGGVFMLRGLPSETPLRVVVEARFGLPVMRVLTLRDDDVRDLEIILSEAGAVNVEVITASGEAARNCLLNADYQGITAEGTESRQQFLGGEGHVIFGGLRPGPWRLTVIPNQGPSPVARDVDVKAGELESISVVVEVE